jgi:Tfp pilus assembly protein PilV
VSRLRTLARREEGFGMLELIIAMMVLNIGIFAVLSAFTSGYTAMKRTKNVTSGAVLSDQQMERLRALNFNSICLSNTSTDSTYTANAPEGTAVPTCSTSDPAMVAVRSSATGPDGASYRVDTYIVWRCTTGTLSTSSPYSTSSPGCVTSGSVVSYATKLVRVIVRNPTSTGTVYAQIESIYDQSTGQ